MLISVCQFICFWLKKCGIYVKVLKEGLKGARAEVSDKVAVSARSTVLHL